MRIGEKYKDKYSKQKVRVIGITMGIIEEHPVLENSYFLPFKTKIVRIEFLGTGNTAELSSETFINHYKKCKK